MPLHKCTRLKLVEHKRGLRVADLCPSEKWSVQCGKYLRIYKSALFPVRLPDFLNANFFIFQDSINCRLGDGRMQCQKRSNELIVSQSGAMHKPNEVRHRFSRNVRFCRALGTTCRLDLLGATGNENVLNY